MARIKGEKERIGETVKAQKDSGRIHGLLKSKVAPPLLELPFDGS